MPVWRGKLSGSVNALSTLYEVLGCTRKTYSHNYFVSLGYPFSALTFPLVTSNALTGVNLIVRPFRQLLSFGCVNSSLPSTAKRTSSWCHSSRSMAIFRSLILIMSISQEDRRPGLDDDMRRHSLVGTSFASRFIWFRCSSIFSCDCFKRSRPSRCGGVTLNSRASSSGYLVTRCTGT